MNRSNNADIDQSNALNYLTDYLLAHEDLSPEICDYFYSHLLTKFDQLRHHFREETSSVRIVEYYQLRVHDMLRNEDASLRRLHLLQLMFHFGCLMQEVSNSTAGHDDPQSCFLIYANFAAMTIPTADPNFNELRQAIGYFLEDSVKQELCTQVEKCHRIYPLHQTLSNVRQLHWSLVDDDHLEDIRCALKQFCVPVCSFPYIFDR